MLEQEIQHAALEGGDLIGGVPVNSARGSAKADRAQVAADARLVTAWHPPSQLIAHAHHLPTCMPLDIILPRGVVHMTALFMQD